MIHLMTNLLSFADEAIKVWWGWGHKSLVVCLINSSHVISKASEMTCRPHSMLTGTHATSLWSVSNGFWRGKVNNWRKSWLLPRCTKAQRILEQMDSWQVLDWCNKGTIWHAWVYMIYSCRTEWAISRNAGFQAAGINAVTMTIWLACKWTQIWSRQ